MNPSLSLGDTTRGEPLIMSICSRSNDEAGAERMVRVGVILVIFIMSHSERVIYAHLTISLVPDVVYLIVNKNHIDTIIMTVGIRNAFHEKSMQTTGNTMTASINSRKPTSPPLTPERNVLDEAVLPVILLQLTDL